MIGREKSKPKEIVVEFQTMREVQLDYCLYVLEELNGNKTQAAKALGISIRTIRNWINQNQLERAIERFRYQGHVLNGKTVPKPRSVPLVDPRNYHPITGAKLRPGEGQDA